MTGTTLPQPAARRTPWSHYPIWLLIAMGLVFAVNARFVYVAVTTFPGTPTSDDFDSSNNYNSVLSAVERQNALGWQVRANDTGPAPAIQLNDRTGQPLAGAALQAVARRPLGNDADQTLTFESPAPGRFVLTTALARGQWDLMLHITNGDQTMRVTRRVVVR